MMDAVQKIWSSQWMKIRAKYLADKLPEFVLHPAEDFDDEWYWECMECGALGEASLSYGRAERAGSGHVSSHVTDEDREALEDLKVTKMPEELLTPYQRARKRRIQNQ